MSKTYGTTQVPTSLKAIRVLSRSVSTLSANLGGYLAFQLFCTPMNRSKKEVPFNPRTMTFTHKNRQIIGYEWAGSGETILLVHGWESSTARFKKLLEKLIEQDYHIFAMDAPAHGASSGRQTNPLDYSDAVHEFIQHIGHVDTIIGHSMGGGTTMLLLDRYPEIKPKNIVLIASINSAKDAIQMFADVIQLPKSALEHTKRYLLKYANNSFEKTSSAYIATKRTENALIIHDTDDNIVDVSNGRMIATNWQNSHYHETTGLGHRHILNHTPTLNRILQFLKDKS